MAFNLRKRTSISYYEPEKPSFDEYVYCEQCSDFVYEYCALHGPLLVIPDDKVPVKTNFSSCVPHAALTVPHVFLHLAPSIIPGAGIGVFSTLTLPRGVRFGPYRGQRTQQAHSSYCWQIYDRNNKPSHVVDAADDANSNWMRYVNCARHWREQNLLAYQYKGQLYYRTIKIIPRFTELMVFYGSEFANMLHVNLSKYNCDKYYRDILSTPFIFENQNHGNATYYPSETPHENANSKKDEIHMNTTQTESIEKVNAEEENTQNDLPIETCITQNNIICTNIDDNVHIEVLYREDNMTINFNNNTEETTFKCNICQKTFAQSSYLRRHTKIHSNPPYKCEFCKFKTYYKSRFEEHRDKHTKSFLYSCQICFYKSDSKQNYNRHCLRHKQKDNTYFPMPRQCDICAFKTSSRRSFSTHKSQHKGNIIKCDLCNYSTHCNYNLSKHILRKH